MQKVRRQGFYAPKTKSNNYFIFLRGSYEEKVLAHNYAHVRNPHYYDDIVDTIEAIWNFVDPSA